MENPCAVSIGAHPGLNGRQKQVIERDYGMLDGSL